MIAAVGGVVVLRCIVTLLALSFTGPGGYWFSFWTEPTRRTVYIAIAFALFVWVFVAAGVGARGAGRPPPRDRARCSPASAPGSRCRRSSSRSIGLETALTVWNDEMGLLPWGLARILGITVYLDIPADTAVDRRRLRPRARRDRGAAGAAVRARRSPCAEPEVDGRRRPDELSRGRHRGPGWRAETGVGVRA